MSEFAAQDDAQAGAVGNTQADDEKGDGDAGEGNRAKGKKSLDEWQGVGEIDDEPGDEHGGEEKANGDEACETARSAPNLSCSGSMMATNRSMTKSVPRAVARISSSGAL